jgi:xanthine dehydrogenase small subunit
MELVSSAGTRPLPVESFATGVRTNALEPGEFVARIRIPLGSFDREVHAYKVARRFDDDISSVSAVLAVRSDAGRPVEARLVFGGLAATVRRAPRSEAELLAGRWDEATLRAVQSSLRDDFAPIDDHRATGWYRGQAAAGLLERWWVERTGSEAAQHDIWAVR